MSVVYEVRSPAPFPEASALVHELRSMAADFAFEAPFDFMEDSGWCPCRLGGKAAGFEWERVDEPPAVDRLPVVAQVSVRSSLDDHVCAVIVAAALVERTGGQLVTPDGQEVSGAEALQWARARTASVRSTPRRTARRKAPIHPEALMASWLAELPGQRVARVFRSLPDDPQTSFCFEQGLTLRATRWTFEEGSGTRHSTLDLPRSLTAASQQDLERSVGRLIRVLSSEAVLEGRLDGLALEFAFPSGVLRVFPEGRVTLPKQDYLTDDRWEVRVRLTSVLPDLELTRLIVR